MALVNGYGQPIIVGTSVKATPLEYNFSAYTDMLAKNSGVTPKAEFKSDTPFGDKMYCGGIVANNKV